MQKQKASFCRTRAGCPCFAFCRAVITWRMTQANPIKPNSSRKRSESLQVEIFRPGTFRSMEGEDVVLTDSDLAGVAESYDPAHDAPAVIGHPAIDAPAYGWVKRLKYDQGSRRLIAVLDDIDASFAEAVRAKKFKKVSASFFAPDSPANPKPGHLYLRHVGFLGAAAPAVSGLQSVHFAGASRGIFTISCGANKTEVCAINFSEKKSMSFLDRLRAFLADKLGQEKANEILADNQLEKLAADDEAEAAQAALADAAGTATAPETVAIVPADAVVTENGNGDGGEDEEKKKASASFAAQMNRREEALKKREDNLRNSARHLMHSNHVSFAADLVRTGRILPAHKDGLVRALDAVTVTAGTVSFADGTKVNPAREIQEIFRSLPASVSFSDGLPPDEKDKSRTASFSAPDNFEADPERMELYEKAKKYMVDHPDVDFATAVKIVEEQG